ncbi:MAG: TatD family hydrolase [Magnetovibrionaceae bacterium]
MPDSSYLVDSHCHLDFPEFADQLDDVISRAGEAGIGAMLTICTHVSKFEQVLKIAEAYEHIFCTVGIHPHNAGPEPATSAEELIELAAHPKVVGFGETGLDFFYDNSPRDDQVRNFRSHIEAARRTGLPVIVHTRDADDETIAMIDEEMEQGAFPGLIHCFSGGPDLARVAVGHGLYISISGIVTFKKADELRETVSGVPLDHLLVETDAPFLAPVPRRGKTNEPAFTAFTAAKVAELKGVSAETLAEATTDNFFRLFDKAQRPL